MSARWILSFMIVGCLAMAGMFYVAIKRAPELKGLVTDQMHMEFLDYSNQIKHTDRLQVAESNGEKYFVSLQKEAPWKFEIHDKLLYVVAPTPVGETKQEPLSAELLPAARKPVEDFIWVWLEDKYHTRKDLQLEVHFPNEPQAQ